jgi:hypothetical protein
MSDWWKKLGEGLPEDKRRADEQYVAELRKQLGKGSKAEGKSQKGNDSK